MRRAIEGMPSEPCHVTAQACRNRTPEDYQLQQLRSARMTAGGFEGYVISCRVHGFRYMSSLARYLLLCIKCFSQIWQRERVWEVTGRCVGPALIVLADAQPCSARSRGPASRQRRGARLPWARLSRPLARATATTRLDRAYLNSTQLPCCTDDTQTLYVPAWLDHRAELS